MANVLQEETTWVLAKVMGIARRLWILINGMGTLTKGNISIHRDTNLL